MRDRDYIKDVVNYFIEHLDEISRDDHPDEWSGGDVWLTQLLDHWITQGQGIRAVAGDHNMFLRVVILIIDRLATHRYQFGTWADRIGDRYLPNAEEDPLPACLDPDEWKVTVWRKRVGPDPTGDRYRH